MTLVKIGDVKPPCMNPSHNPPMHIVLQPGVYEHTCPGCGVKQKFTVTGPIWSVSNTRLGTQYGTSRGNSTCM